MTDLRSEPPARGQEAWAWRRSWTRTLRSTPEALMAGSQTIYGMNLEAMLELGWRYGYPMAIALMLLMGLGLHTAFKRRGWL
jgi:hypothetical protein